MSDGREFPSQLLYGARQILLRYVQQVMDFTDAQAQIGVPYVEVTRKDYDSYDVKDFRGNDLVFQAYWLAYDGIERRMRLPDTLLGLNVIYEKGGGATDYTETGSSGHSGSYSLGMSVGGSAQASAFCIPKVLEDTREIWSYNPPVKHYFYYGQDFDQASIIARLSAQLGESVNPWPVFKPESHNILCTGQRVSATGRASAQGSASDNGTSNSATLSHGFGWGLEIAPVIEIVKLGAMLHDDITISPTTDSISFDAVTAVAASGDIPLSAAGTATAEAIGTISPSSFSATSPPGLPASGLYIFDFDIAPDSEQGWYFGHAIVFDFSTLS